MSALQSPIKIFDTAVFRPHRQLKRAMLLTHLPERKKIMALDINGDGVDEIEFIVGMLHLLGVTLCGEPLGYNDVLPFRILFKRLDVSTTGKLSNEGLEAYVKLTEQAAKKRQDLKMQPVGSAEHLQVRTPASAPSRTG